MLIPSIPSIYPARRTIASVALSCATPSRPRVISTNRDLATYLRDGLAPRVPAPLSPKQAEIAALAR